MTDLDLTLASDRQFIDELLEAVFGSAFQRGPEAWQPYAVEAERRGIDLDSIIADCQSFAHIVKAGYLIRKGVRP